ncbi:hypothetical protein LY01_02256 [Nonlabens xylanidelens]|uniref:Uncharacterized protein n=1 Tax=Nonlabens xylanidelens TaxID=191564 RepID=A0A2S6III2_9FLAO|nr:hypothetical protein LY01_02256 [Nonlabens xylanidelens]
MENLINYIQSRVLLTQKDIDLIKKYFVSEEVSAKTNLLEAGKVERYIYFLETRLFKGYIFHYFFSRNQIRVPLSRKRTPQPTSSNATYSFLFSTPALDLKMQGGHASLTRSHRVHL